MSEVFWLVAAAILSLTGMSWLALAMKAHWSQLYQDRKLEPRRSLLRVMGSAALVVSGLCCLQADHPSMAVLVWVMLMAGAAIAVAMILGRQPRLLGLLCPGFLGKSQYLDNNL